MFVSPVIGFQAVSAYALIFPRVRSYLLAQPRAQHTQEMKVRDDPRGAAELFCAQNGVTDPETIDLLEDTLRRLYLPAWSYTRASGPDPSNPDTWPPVPPKKKSQDSAASPGRTADKPGADSNNNQERPQPGRDDGVGGVHSSPVGTSEPAGASGARGDGAHTAGGGSRAASGLTDAATAHETFRAVDPTSHGAAGQPEQLQQQQQQQQQQQRGHQNQEPQGKGEDEQEPGGHPEARGGSNEAAAVAGGAPPPAVKTVMEVAQEMKGELTRVCERKKLLHCGICTLIFRPHMPGNLSHTSSITLVRHTIHAAHKLQLSGHKIAQAWPTGAPRAFALH